MMRMSGEEGSNGAIAGDQGLQPFKSGPFSHRQLRVEGVIDGDIVGYSISNFCGQGTITGHIADTDERGATKPFRLQNAFAECRRLFQWKRQSPDHPPKSPRKLESIPVPAPR
jgi:hypothetical protein